MLDDFYCLTRKPFQFGTDNSSYFCSVAQQKALSFLGYNLAQGEALTVIVGEAGSGKSTLAAHLLGAGDSRQFTVGQACSRTVEEAGFAQSVAQSFGLDGENRDHGSVAGSIEEFLRAEARGGRRCLLIIDEMQALSGEAFEDLHMMSHIELAGRPLLQTLLLCRPDDWALLQDSPALAQLGQAELEAHQLGPLERIELERYMVHRLECAGWSGSPQFDQRVFAELHQASAGIPGRINRIAIRLLQLGAIERRTRIDAVMLRTVLDEMAGDASHRVAAESAEWPRRDEKVAMSPFRGQAAGDREALAAALAERDTQIARLQQAVEELADQLDAARAFNGRSACQELDAHCSRLETRLVEQERAMRQMLTMLIDWVDGEAEQSRVA